VLFDLDGTLVDLRTVYVDCHRSAVTEVLGVELAEERVLELMATGRPIGAHMRLLSDEHADRLLETFVLHYRRAASASATCRPTSGRRARPGSRRSPSPGATGRRRRCWTRAPGACAARPTSSARSSRGCG
jgi:phosphoglycolate phosphatase-like HAD superfamily hydrolase